MVKSDMSESSKNNEVKQKYLGNKGLIILISLLSAFVPLSTDLYLPALPMMSEYFHVSQAVTNLTLIMFFVFFSIGTLVFGPLSDKYGRKPVLIMGLVFYLIGSIMCVFSANMTLLIFSRIIQAVGGSAASAVATAIVKDVYSGKKRESVLSIVQSMTVISPAIAPVLGSWILKVTSWRGIFVGLALIGLASLVGSILLNETLTNYNKGTVIQTLGRLGVVLKNPGFSSMLLIFSIVNIACMAFISASSYIYQEGFKLTSEVYSYYFTLNAVGMLFGPFLYLKLAGHLKREFIIDVCFIVMIASGILVCIFDNSKPWVFALSLLPSTIASCCMRPPSTNLMLEQQKKDTGSASSLIGGFAMIMGSVGMVIVSFNWSNQVFVIGVLNAVIGLICGIGWKVAYKKPYVRHFSEIDMEHCDVAE